MIEKYLVKPDMTVKNVIAYMEDENLKAVVVADESRRLIGLFSLGDMRHFFLNNGDLSAKIIDAMNRNPVVFHSNFDVEKYDKKLVLYPVVDEKQIITNIIVDGVEEKVTNALAGVPVVIMAGGKGTRLYPYTKILPKALIPIGEYTISERIIESFRKYGCKDFHMILNHKAEMIRSYFNDIRKEYNITFTQEEKFLGTGGGLAYLGEKITDTFFLSNCDILINADFECIYKTHKKEKNKITFVCAMKDVVIPYGIVETDTEGKIIHMKEKPEFSFLTNTGLYIVEPEVIESLNKDEFIHMPDIAQRYIEKGENVGVFPISESAWMDMGQFSEMESMMKKLGINEY